MNIQINTANEIGKLLAFIRARGKASFEVRPEVLEVCLSTLRAFAKEHNIRIELVNPDQQKIAAFSGAGMLAGAAIGYVVATIPGAFAGAVIGGVAGLTLAHVTICVHLPAANGGPFTTLQVN